MISNVIPVSAVIPTAGRRERLIKTLRSILAQDSVPEEILVIDCSATPWTTEHLCGELGDDVNATRILVMSAKSKGAGSQRNQGVAVATQALIWFLDDDVDLEASCLSALYRAMESDPSLGGCNAVLTNQSYHEPGRSMRRILALLGCPATGSLAGRCCGPALNFLPALARDNLNTVDVDWLNTGCTLYRREALPRPPFLPFFTGYSLMEDAALSLQVRKRWKLQNVPSARVFHDSQPGVYKSQIANREAMEITNRWFVMTRVMGRSGLLWQWRFFAYQLVGVVLALRASRFAAGSAQMIIGRCIGVWAILTRARKAQGYEQPA